MTNRPEHPVEKTIAVKWVKSAIGKPAYQKKTIRGLGFRRLNQTLILPDQAQIRGLVGRVSHLLKVVD